MKLALVLDDIPVESVLDIAEDLAGTPSLTSVGNITATDNGGTRILPSLTDNDEAGLDFDPDDGELFDPFGVSVVVGALAPALPVPLFGQGLWVILGGLISFVGGLFTLRGRAK